MCVFRRKEKIIIGSIIAQHFIILFDGSGIGWTAEGQTSLSGPTV